MKQNQIFTSGGCALSPKSEIFRFPWESRRRFSGWKNNRRGYLECSRGNTSKLTILRTIPKLPSDPYGKPLCYGRTQHHQSVAENIYELQAH